MAEREAAMRSEPSGTHASPAALWFGVLAGPVAWSVQMLVNYNAEDMVACAPASNESATILGVSVTTLIQATNAVCALATTAAGVIAFIAWRRLSARPGSSPADRPEWMARAGVMVSILFLLMIAMGFAGPQQEQDRKSTRLNSSHRSLSRMPSSA